MACGGQCIPHSQGGRGQAHVATLLGGQKCIVKVQYPEVAELYEADFDNLETVVAFLMPQVGAACVQLWVESRY